jgi:hypothetical protein
MIPKSVIQYNLKGKRDYVRLKMKLCVVRTNLALNKLIKERHTSQMQQKGNKPRFLQFQIILVGLDVRYIARNNLIKLKHICTMTLTWFYFKLVMSSRILICTILAYNI